MRWRVRLAGAHEAAKIDAASAALEKEMKP
jgi:hypothetical protein